VRAWLDPLPTWVDVFSSAAIMDPGLSSLGRGEREAIQFAEEHHADLILIDERKGYLEARRRGLVATGTLGVLLSAGELGLVDAEACYRRLVRETTFRTSAMLEHQFLENIRLS
jgi:predicted nucleic acid-binding protein